MAQKTIHIVQPFAHERGGLKAENARVVDSREIARRIAQRMHSPKRSVLAFSRTGDPGLGEFGPGEVIAEFGEIPSELVEAFCGE